MAFDLGELLKNVSNLDTGREQIQYIPLDQIDEDPNNFYQLSEIPALADNISLCGLQQPIRLRQKTDGRYQIVSGHRRRAALEMLAADGYDQWKEAPCIVETDDANPTLQQLRLIYANANTRKMTAAELSEQAEQVEKLLYQLKEEGYSFPGRMRDHVAEAVGASKSKLARLRVIRENLDPSWADDWKEGRLTESQAYAMAQMPKSWQAVVKEGWPYGLSSLTAERITRFRDGFNRVCKIQCQYGLQLCEHTVTMMGNICKDNYSCSCAGCCFDCDSLQTCKNCCPEAKGKQKEMKAVAKKASFDAKREQEERDRPGTEFARLVWQRVGLARKASGVSVKEIVFARGESFYDATCDDPKQEKQENGEGHYSPSELISFGYGITAADMMNVIAVADALRCSVDYLLGRTERMELVPDSCETARKSEPVPNSGTTWQAGESIPEAVGAYILLTRFTSISDVEVEIWNWTGAEWQNGYDESYEEHYHGKILRWAKAPEDMTW